MKYISMPVPAEIKERERIGISKQNKPKVYTHKHKTCTQFYYFSFFSFASSFLNEIVFYLIVFLNQKGKLLSLKIVYVFIVNCIYCSFFCNIYI